ncbi:MAG: hypothetical protein ACK559_42305, partial [bacterium]
VQVSEKYLPSQSVRYFFHLRYTAKLKIERNSRKLKCKKENVYFFVLPVCRQIMLNIFQQLRTKCGQRGRERLKMLNLAKNTKICTLRALANISAGPFSH